MQRRKEVRLEDIAETVGVSIVAVSNALKGRKGVSDEMREKIQNAAMQMGYQMPRAETKSRDDVDCIGILIAERYVKQFPSLYMDIYKLAAREITKKGNISILEVVDEEKERMLNGFFGVLHEDVEGILIIGEMSRDYVAQVRRKHQVPIVCIDYYDAFPDMDYIVCDSFGGMEQMTELLLDAGCRSFVFVGTPEASGSIMDRYLGCCKALEKRGIRMGPENVIYDRIADGYDYWLGLELPQTLPDAFVCNCDRSANILLRMLLDRGVKVPEDVSVVGFDHHYSSEYEGMELTTFENNKKELARIGVRTIFKRIKERKGTQRDNQKLASGIRFVQGKIIYGNTARLGDNRK